MPSFIDRDYTSGSISNESLHVTVEKLYLVSFIIIAALYLRPGQDTTMKKSIEPDTFSRNLIISGVSLCIMDKLL